MAFQFLDPGLLRDDDLELVSPEPRWLPALLEACHHPLTLRLEPAMAATTRQQITAFLNTHPHGHQEAQPQRGWAPTYHFWMRLHNRPDIPCTIAGGIGLRVGHSKDLEYYTGHIGYHVYPAARGHHYAERACRLLLPLARRHGLTDLWITCNPDNLPSRRTCQRLGAQLVEIVTLPPDHLLYAQGERQKCRYHLPLPPIPPSIKP